MSTPDGYRPIEENEECEECGGVADFVVHERCYCHLSPPCHYCESKRPQCTVCGAKFITIVKAEPTGQEKT